MCELNVAALHMAVVQHGMIGGGFESPFRPGLGVSRTDTSGPALHALVDFVHVESSGMDHGVTEMQGVMWGTRVPHWAGGLRNFGARDLRAWTGKTGK